MKNSCKKIHCSLGALDRTAEGAAAQSHTGHVGRFGFEDSLPMGSSRGKPNNWELAAGLTRDQETSLLCALIAFTYGPRSCRIIISEDPALKARLAGYFEELSCVDPPRHELSVDDVETLVADPPISCDLPTLEVTRKALEQLKDGKAPGTCGVYAEMLKAGGESGMKWTHRLFCSVWNSCVIPTD